MNPEDPLPVDPGNPRPILTKITVALASHPPDCIPNPPNVINLSAVAVVNEASLTATSSAGRE